MGVIIEGAKRTEDALHELAWSFDPDIDPGELEACGWCPASDFAKLNEGAEVFVMRQVSPRERDRQRDLFSRQGGATANSFVVLTTLMEFRRLKRGKWEVTKDPKKLSKIVETMQLKATQALDYLANQVLSLSAGNKPEDYYDEVRQAFGYAPLTKNPTPPEGGAEDSKSAG